MEALFNNSNYYDLLGVRQDADARDIKRAFRKKVRELHPDLNPEISASGAELQQVIEAYQRLSMTTEECRRARIEDAFKAAGTRYQQQDHSAENIVLSWPKVNLKTVILASVMLVVMSFCLMKSPAQDDSQPVRVDVIMSNPLAVQFEQMGLRDWYGRNWWALWFFQQRMSSEPGNAVQHQMAQFVLNEAEVSRSQRHMGESARLYALAHALNPGFVVKQD